MDAMNKSATGNPTRPNRTRHNVFPVSRRLVTIAVCVLMASCNKDEHAKLLTYGTPSTGDGGVPTCRAGLEGCPCDVPSDQHLCGKLVRTEGDYVTCSEGLSTCENGAWGVCEGEQLVTRTVQSVTLQRGGASRLMNAQSTCNDPCDPYCGLVTSDALDAVDAGGIKATPTGGVSLADPTGTGTGTGRTCSGWQCSVKACNGNVKATKLTGRVFDPAGKVPLYNANVYVPVDTDLTKLPSLSDAWVNGVACDRCTDTTVRAVSVTQTDTSGAFTLEAIPSGTNVPLVVQMGKWRRVIVLSTINECADNAISNNCTATDKSLCAARLPRNRFDGYNPANGSYSYVSASGANGKADIPKIAMISGAADPFECMLLKAGLDPNEFGSYDKYPERRVHYYHSPDKPGSKLYSTFGNQITGAVLWNSSTSLAQYDVVIPACEGDSVDKLQSVVKPPTGVNPYRNLIGYTDRGGRVFTTHYGYVWLEYPYAKSNIADWRYVANWTHLTGTSTTQAPLTASIVTTFPKGSKFSDWLAKIGATNSAGVLQIADGRQDLTTVGANAQSWMAASNTRFNPASAFVPHFTFNTPYGAADAAQCGRLVFSDFHVSANALTTGTSCYSAADCGFTATCTGGVAPAVGTCSEPCATNSDCSPGYTCSGTVVAGSCTPLNCSGSCSAGGTCVGGACKCTSDGQCGSELCTLAAGTCAASSCMQDSNCGPSEYCSGASGGTCSVDYCRSDWDCASGYCDWNGKCACTSGSQCSSKSCSAPYSTCSAASCNSDNQICGASETCTLGTSGSCAANGCNRDSDCSSGKCDQWSRTCTCTKTSQCGSGRSCNWGTCSTKSCTSDSTCRTFEHCQRTGTCGPAPCVSGTCASGICEADGKCHCQSDWQCQSDYCSVGTGTCNGTAASCMQDSSCGSVESCSGTRPGSCLARSCSPSNPCPAGSCIDGACKCTGASQCASNACNSTGACNAKACYVNNDCGVTEQCSGGKTGTCVKTCTVDIDCTNGETCAAGKCTGCTSSTQCQTANYPATCVGSSGGTKGTCSLTSSSYFPQACKQGNLTAQEKALEFMFFDLTACVTPDGYDPPAPVSLYAAATFSPPDYVAACDQGFLPRWRELRWRADIPSTASIVFAAQSGADAASLLPATPLTIATATTSTAPSSTDYAYLDAGINGSGAFNLASQPVTSDDILRLTITLNPSQPDLLQAPVLLDWSVVYDCVPSK
jgi:hypothetical protein